MKQGSSRLAGIPGPVLPPRQDRPRRLGQRCTCDSGPAPGRNCAVLSTWMPACCSPLNGVTTGCVAPGSQPRLKGRLGSLNHSPRWYWWVGPNVVLPPGDTENVSTSKTPRTVAWPKPWWSALMSVWYQDTPNGLFGCSITNRSKSASRGMPKIESSIVSFCDPGVMVTRPPACGRQDLMPGDGTRRKVNAPLCRAPVTGAADAAVKLRALATAVVASPAAAQIAARRRRCLVIRMNAPLFRWPCPRGAAGVGQGYAARGAEGSM